jgi:hypothetical protein
MLFLDAVEIANGARTVAYLSKGLGPRQIRVEAGCPCSVLSREAGVPSGGFVSPSADGAPWYSAAQAWSAEFLGLLVERIDFLDAANQRAVDDRASAAQGAELGPLRMGGRKIRVEGWLVASTDDGLAWGRSWLSDRLVACGACASSTARVRAFCPPDNATDDTRGQYLIYGVGLTEGLDLGGDALGDDCPYMVPVAFTLTASSPWLYTALVACLAETTLNPSLGANTTDPFTTVVSAAWTTDTGTVPVVNAGQLQPANTNTFRLRRNDRVMLNGSTTWKVVTGASVVGFGVDVFGRGAGAAQTYLAAQWVEAQQFRIVKLVAGAQTVLATAGGPSLVPVVGTTYWVRFGWDGPRLSAELWNADPALATSTPASNRLRNVEHVLTQANVDLFLTGNFTGLHSLVSATDERYDDYVFDASVCFNRWWTYQWPDAQTCSPTVPSYGGISSTITLKAGATHQVNGAIIAASTGGALVPTATQTTSLTLVTEDGDLRGVATIRGVPILTTLVIDAAQRTLTATDALGVQSDGTQYLAISTGLVEGDQIWVAADRCNGALVLQAISESYAGTAEDATGTIQTQTRQRS